MTDEEARARLRYLQLKARAAEAQTAPAEEAQPFPGGGDGFFDVGATPGPKETFANRAAQALPLGKQLVNTLTALGLQAQKARGLGDPGAALTPQAQAELARLAAAGDTEAAGQLRAATAGNTVPGLLDSYRQSRADFDTRTAAGSEQNPVAAGLGTGAGVLLSLAAPLPKVSVGSGALGRIASNALTGGAYGALNSAANSKGNLTEGDVGQVLSDAVGVEGLKQAQHEAAQGRYGRALLDLMGSGALGGATTGGLISAATEGARASGALQKASDYVKTKALNTGRRVLTNGADSLSTRKPVADAAVEEAIRSGAIKPFSTTEGALKRLGEKTEEGGKIYNALISELEQRGVTGPDAQAVADQLMKRGAFEELNTLNKAIPAEYMGTAEQVADKAAGNNGVLRLSQAENLKRSAQRMAKYARTQLSPMEEAHQDIASILRQANEDAIARAASTPDAARTGIKDLADQFVPVKQRLGRLLEAEAAATRGAARVAQRSPMSLGDKALAAGALASGHPEAVLAPLASGFLRNRGASAAASYGLSLADLLSANPGAGGDAGRMAALLAEALKDKEKKR